MSQAGGRSDAGRGVNRPRVSVTMVIRDVERFLSECIESVLRQTFSDLEFVIVDFGSTDNSRAIAQMYASQDARIRFREIPPCTLVAARNTACSYAEGQYIAVMDADDVCLPERLERQIEFMDRHPDVGLLGGAVEWIDTAGRPIDVFGNPCCDEDLRRELAERCPFWHPTVFVRREVLALIGGYRDAFIFAHDYDMEIRVAEQCRVANLSQVLLRYRIHPWQVSLRKLREQSLCKLAAQRSASLRRAKQPDPFSEIREITAGALAELGVTPALQERHFVRGFHAWIRNLRRAGEDDVALAATADMLHSSRWEDAEQRLVADLWITAAKLYWQRRRLWHSTSAVARAVRHSPRVLGRPLKALHRRLTTGKVELANRSTACRDVNAAGL